MPAVSRNDLLEVLESWRLHRTIAKDVQAWAEARYGLDDWEPEDAVVNEILARLDALDMNLITPDDVPAFLEALSVPANRSQEAIDGIDRHFETVNIESRQMELHGDPLYAPFCE